MNCDNCIFFVAALRVAFAYDDISYKKMAIQSHTTIGTGSDASNAVDGNRATCIKTLPIGIGSFSLDKTVWWKVDFGGVYNIYSINIQFKNYEGYVDRQKGRLAGFSLYVSYTDVSTTADIKGSTLCYKNGPLLPPLDFSTTCIKSGRYVIFYNERLDGVVYPKGYEVINVFTEICEVIIQGCINASLYGSNCNNLCPTNCKDGTCHIQSGACFNCKPGWTGVHCNTKCAEGWHGVNCSQPCVGHCKNRTTCNHVTGRCDGGCDAGWTESNCDKECNDGTYGNNCVNKCSGHCLDDYPCNKQTGHCEKGCKPGYTNDDCNKVCPSGQYGINCRESCSGLCLNNESCDHISGACSGGCQDGFVGTHCNNSCTKGYFGTNCSQACLPNCQPDTCRHTDGSCICAAGWTGTNCTKGRTGNLLMKQEMSSCIIFATGLSISLVMNFIFIGCGILLCRRIHPNRMTVSCSLLSCWKKSVYQDTFVKTDETLTYQELNLSDSAYQNTTIR